MDMADTPDQSQTVTLSLPLEEHWTLHHVLLDRVEQESIEEESTEVDSLPVEVFQAFETLDAGDISFTIDQLEVMQSILAEAHHSSRRWVIERSRLEQLLHRITSVLKQSNTPLPAE